MSIEAGRRTLLQMLQRHLLPLANQPRVPFIFMEPSHLRQGGYSFSTHFGQPLNCDKRMRSPILLQQWPKQQVHAIRFPCLAVVVEGEIDWRIGITQSSDSLCRNNSTEENNLLIVPVPAKSFFLVPPIVPYSDGSGLHWERSSPRTGQAVIFWMIILPSGVMCHFCRSTATEHRSHREVFVLCPAAYPLAKMLEKEFGEEQPDRDLVVRAHLQTILIYVQRALEKQINSVPIELQSAASSPISAAALH